MSREKAEEYLANMKNKNVINEMYIDLGLKGVFHNMVTQKFKST